MLTNSHFEQINDRLESGEKWSNGWINRTFISTISSEQWGTYKDSLGNTIDTMLPSKLYALIKACDVAKKKNIHKESSIPTMSNIPIVNKEANFTMKQQGGQQRRNKKGKFYEKRPYSQKHPSREYIVKLKKEFGDNYIECSHCHWLGHTFASCRKCRNKRQFNKPSGNNQCCHQPENQNHQE